MKIAIVSFYHSEATLCLAKYIGMQDVHVDCFLICDYLRDKGFMPGIDYHRASKKLGIYEIKNEDCPEILAWAGNSNVTYHLLRVFSYSPKFYWLYKIVINQAIKSIKSLKYDCIDIIGQHPWLEYIHKKFYGENIVHSLHEVGTTHVGGCLTPYLQTLIKDRSKIRFFSSYVEKRFHEFDSQHACQTTNTNIGVHETTKLYGSDCKMELPIDINKTTFLFYGFLKPYKGLTLLKEAIIKLDDIQNNFNLIIAGAGHDDTLDFFSLQKNVCVINRFLSDEEMQYLNKISHIVVLPYKTASQSGIILTSFMYGNPIIATKVGALAENIISDYNGLLVEPEDAEGFANAMRRMVKEPSLLNKLRQGALSFGHGDKSDWNVIAKKTLTFMFDKNSF